MSPQSSRQLSITSSPLFLSTTTICAYTVQSSVSTVLATFGSFATRLLGLLLLIASLAQLQTANVGLVITSGHMQTSA